MRSNLTPLSTAHEAWRAKCFEWFSKINESSSMFNPYVTPLSAKFFCSSVLLGIQHTLTQFAGSSNLQTFPIIRLSTANSGKLLRTLANSYKRERERERESCKLWTLSYLGSSLVGLQSLQIVFYPLLSNANTIFFEIGRERER